LFVRELVLLSRSIENFFYKNLKESIVSVFQDQGHIYKEEYKRKIDFLFTFREGFHYNNGKNTNTMKENKDKYKDISTPFTEK